MPDNLNADVREATRLIIIRLGAAALVRLAAEEPQIRLYGPGFEILITRTDPTAWYPGKPESDGR